MIDAQTQEEQARRTEYARTAPWQITPLPNADRQAAGVWRVRDMSNGHRPHTVVLRSNGDWDCDCLDCEFNGGLRCRHIEAVRLYLAGEITAQTSQDTQMNNRISQSQTQKGDIQMNNRISQTQNNQTFGTSQTQVPRWAARQYERGDSLAPSYPYVQWVNDPAMLEPRQEKGGFACPIDQGIPLPGILTLFHTKEGKAIEVIFAQQIAVAVLATRFSWTLDGVRIPAKVKGARGKLQALCLLRIPDNRGYTAELVMLTFMGVAGSRFYAAYRKFVSIVRAATRGRAPAYAFWMKVGAGERLLVGTGKEKSYITDVTLNEDFDPDRDYVGDEALDSVLWPEIDRWAKAWRSPGPNGEGVIGDEETEADFHETYGGTHADVEEAGETDADEAGVEETRREPYPASQAHWYPEGSLDWAMRQVLPFDGRTAKAGTPLYKLSDEALEYLANNMESQYPAAAKAARVLLRMRREPAPSEIPC